MDLKTQLNKKQKKIINERLVFIVSDEIEENKISQNEKLLLQHHFSYSISIMIPSTNNLEMERLVSFANYSYFKIKSFQLQDLMDVNFIEAFINRGEFSMLSINRILHTENVICFCEGKLFIHILKDDYLKSGLIGKKSTIKNLNKYLIELEIRNIDFDSKKYKRIKQCLGFLDESVDCFFHWKSHDKSIDDASVVAYLLNEGYEIENGTIEIKESKKYNQHIPVLNPAKFREDQFDFESFYEWLGVVTCNCEFGETDNYANKLIYPMEIEKINNNIKEKENKMKEKKRENNEKEKQEEEEKEEKENGERKRKRRKKNHILNIKTKIEEEKEKKEEEEKKSKENEIKKEVSSQLRTFNFFDIKGFFPPYFVERLLKDLRSCTDEKLSQFTQTSPPSKSLFFNTPFISMTTIGFQDSPISWGSNEHSHVMSGDNNHTIIFFPNPPDNKTFCSFLQMQATSIFF